MFRIALLALILVLVGPLATRTGLVRFPLGLGMVAVGSLLAVGILAAVVVTALRGGGWANGMSTLLISLAALAVPVWQLVSVGLPPPIHDISTDTGDPPVFTALLPLRGGDASPPDYDGPETAAQQRRAYPDVAPLMLSGAPAEVLSRADRAARALGWTVVASDPSQGRLEATSTTFWFRFTDDVVIRVRPEGIGSRLDIRSKSRVGRGDLGANARRIRTFVAELQRGR